MKKQLIRYIVLLLVLIVYSCGGGSGDGGRDEPTPPPPPPPVDTTVKATTLLTPTANELCSTQPINFTWQAVQHATKYILTVNKVESGKETLAFTKELTGTSHSTSDLEKGKLYKWKVETIGPKNQVMSVVNQFQTESNAVSNHAPFAPELVSPTDGGNYTIGGNTIFRWKCTDPDGDVLKYDLYLGTDKNNLQLVKAAETNDYFTFTNLSVGKIYYWRVDAVDVKGNKTIGQVWSFNAVN
ncbi:hypothetical protein [Daejeonia sp. YH14]|uniref:hypothetical protein n=1 Tax=Daejeonia sp. YH14 TaxID=3439042 RepID=UPI003F492510